MNNQKKTTKGDLERRIKSAVVFVPKDKETKSIFFEDKGLRITVTMDNAVIATMFHQHVFDMVTANGISRPYMYAKRFVEIALDNDCTVKDDKGYVKHSYAKLMSIIGEKEDKTEHYIARYVDMWLSNIFAPLYSIDENEASAFMVYEQYMHNIARQKVLLDEHKEDMTNKQFVDDVIELEKSFMDGVEAKVILNALSDEQRIKEEIGALQEQQMEESLNENHDGEQ